MTAAGYPLSAVSCQRLRKTFGSLIAVDDVSFEVQPGCLFGLVGPDGAGKTTILRMLSGVLRPTSGDALVAGVSVTRNPEEVKGSIAYMSQRFGLYADLTVRENIEFYADLYQVPAAERPRRLERLYQFSNLGPFSGRLAGQLSGGMKQKLSLCCALIHTPKILLLDEPTFGVDPISRRDLWLILHQMVAEAVTIVVSTAYLDEAERCDQVALVDRGRIVALDTPAALQEQLEGTLLQLRVSDARRAVGILRKLPGVRRASLFGESIHLQLADGPDNQAEIRRTLTQSGVDLVEMKAAIPSLEDVFIARVESRAEVQ